VEEAIRFVKQSYYLEDIRVRSYRSLKNLVALVLCSAYFAAVHLGEGSNLQALVHKVLGAAKRIFGAPAFQLLRYRRRHRSHLKAAAPKARCALPHPQFPRIPSNGSSIPSEKMGKFQMQMSLTPKEFG